MEDNNTLYVGQAYGIVYARTDPVATSPALGKVARMDIVFSKLSTMILPGMIISNTLHEKSRGFDPLEEKHMKYIEEQLGGNER